jgi:hypothetical protein
MHNPGQQSTPLCLILSLKFFHPLVVTPRLGCLVHCIEVTFTVPGSGRSPKPIGLYRFVNLILRDNRARWGYPA